MQRLEKLSNILYVLLFGGLLIVVLGTMFAWSFAMAAILPVFVLLFGIYLAKRKRVLSDKACQIVWYVLYILCLAGLLVFCFICEVEPSWDWGQVLHSAANYVLEGTMEPKQYYARYTNNQLCLICVVTLFQWIKKINPSADFVTFKMVSTVISAVFVWLSIGMIYQVAKRVWGQRRACLAGIIAAGCLPLYMYAQYLYTDTPGMLFLTILLYLGVRIYQEKQVRRKMIFAILLGLIAGLTYHIKVIPFIVFVAVIAAVFLQKERLRYKLPMLLVMVLLCAGCIQLVGTYSDQYASKHFGITESLKERWEYPLTHWVMMGLNQNSDGGYEDDDVSFTASFDTKQERTKENIRVIQSRLKCFGILDYLEFVIYDKLPRTWGDSCLAGDNYLSRGPKHPDHPFVQFVVLDGSTHSICLIYTWTYYVILFFGIVLSGLLALGHRGRQDPMMIGRIAMIGIALFQILWECNSRYVITFLPMMILMALDGYFTCKRRLTQAD